MDTCKFVDVFDCILCPNVPGITDSLSKNEWVDETLYEVRGCTTSTECICSEAPRKSRENFAKGVSVHTQTYAMLGISVNNVHGPWPAV